MLPIEGTNDDIKKTKVIRDKQKLAAITSNALDIVEGWSRKDDSRLDAPAQSRSLKTRASLYELTEDGDFFLCSCPSGSKKYFCKHSIGLAIKFKHLEIPDSAKSVPLNEKRSRGRPAKNKGWWSYR